MDELSTEANSTIESVTDIVPDDVQEIEGILTLLQDLMDSVRKEVVQDFLENAITMLQAALDTSGFTSEEDQLIAYHQLIRALLVRYGLHAWIEDLEGCFIYITKGVRPERTKEFIRVIQRDSDASTDEGIQVATQLIQACQSSINVATLENVVCMAMEALASYNSQECGGGPALQIANLWVLLGRALIMQYLSDGEVARLGQVTQSFQASLNCTKDSSVASMICLTSLSYVELLKFLECREIGAFTTLSNYWLQSEVIDEEGRNLCKIGTDMVVHAVDDAQLGDGIALLSASLHCRMEGHPRRGDSLGILACALLRGFERAGDFKQVEESIRLHREALDLRPPPHPDRSTSLNSLANSLSTRFEHRGAFSDLEECIALHREALDLRPPPHPDRSTSLNNLSNSLSTRFEHRGAFSDLEESIRLHREALDLRPPPHPDYSISLNNLANSLSTRFKHRGAFSDLEECIALQREALDLCPPPHTGPSRSASLNNLANSLLTRFKHRGAFSDLEECTALHREALDLRPSPHPDRLMSLNNLASSLLTRFEHRGAFSDLEEGIELYREALDLCPPPHPGRSTSLNNLANSLWTYFEHRGAFSDLEECIALYREALDLRPPPHPDYSILLNNLANSLSTRFERRGAFSDLEECIELHREALDLCPPPHPGRSKSLNNLANSLSTRFVHGGAFSDLEECIALHREVLEMHPPPHPDYSTSLNNLAGSLQTCFNVRGTPQDLQDALDYLQQAAKYTTGSLVARLQISRSWATCAQDHFPDLTLDAHKYSMELLPQLASLDLTLQQRQDVLQHSRDLVGKAARYTISAGQFELSVIFLSTGRSIFWSQALQLRTSVNELMETHPETAEKFITISRQLEKASYTQSSSFSISSMAKEPQEGTAINPNLHTLASQRQQTIEEIRKIPGYEGFLLPPSFSALQFAATHGPVVLLTVSESACDVLIMHQTKSVEHIPLPMLNSEVLKVLKAFIHMPFIPDIRTSEITQDVQDSLLKMLGRDMVLEADTTSITRYQGLRFVLESLWAGVVKPVLTALMVKKTDTPKRVWWCPTGLFATLPIHAAGIYSEDNMPLDCVFEYVVSSYCTSPQDLLHPTPSMSSSFKMTAIIEPEAPNAGHLPATLTELDRIKKYLPDQQNLIAHVGSTNSPNQVEEVVSDIQQSSFVHFGCHGKQNFNNPLESLLLLSGGKLTMSKLIQDCRVPEGALAYLSACETAKADEERPDESLNLVATMMFAGFRSVVGTLWSILDDDAPIVADVFYRHLFRNGKDAPPDARDAAYGLHLATKELGDRGRPLYSWVPYVHYGI